ncbi:hypothetical protein [Zhongshania aquimaris]|uniref:Uncharacterized protein n=1 Tax=Zhongshania aquimaris TaxID=2857107 RepID=A0ABS6VTU4_9GAMM|nr:hypothetical protein [Zhongshania aquimaris]MBW2941735.1 hypothetical protein [Zhongshania aquimaris]
MKTPRLINSKKSTRTVLQASLLIFTGTLATGSAFAQKTPNTSFQNAKPSTQQSVKLSPAVLNEIRIRVAPKLSSAQVEALLSNLASMNYTQVAALTSGSASQLERLIPGVSGTASSVGQSPLSSARQASTSGNNATQKGVQQQKDMRGGFNTGSGFSSDDEDPTKGLSKLSVGGTTVADEKAKKSAKGFPTTNPDTGITVDKREDGSFSISNGTQKEYYDSNYKRAKDPRDLDKKNQKSEPVPDGNAGDSGFVSPEEWRTILAMLGSRGSPDKVASNPGAGGMKVPTTTTAGTPTDYTASRTVDMVQLQEIIRVSVEKLGPKL